MGGGSVDGMRRRRPPRNARVPNTHTAGVRRGGGCQPRCIRRCRPRRPHLRSGMHPSWLLKQAAPEHHCVCEQLVDQKDQRHVRAAARRFQPPSPSRPPSPRRPPSPSRPPLPRRPPSPRRRPSPRNRRLDIVRIRDADEHRMKAHHPRSSSVQLSITILVQRKIYYYSAWIS